MELSHLTFISLALFYNPIILILFQSELCKYSHLTTGGIGRTESEPARF
jgi:hypothetical protein